ncbi:flagellar protein FlaG [Bacillus cihuensis]|uniref:flagellar protein FlaG n=1 Tax=Bacillus cihuensis TaxID=1208599 RepID=UPI000402D357|nr:flagellar protein FlaG [Bacillus cihuensis]
MLKGLSTNVLSSQLRTAISEGVSSYYQREIDAITNSRVIEVNEPSKKQIQDIIESLNKFMKPTHTSVRFEFHEKLNEYYVKVVDDETDETVREIPPKKLLDFYAAMTEFIGMIVDEKI